MLSLLQCYLCFISTWRLSLFQCFLYFIPRLMLISASSHFKCFLCFNAISALFPRALLYLLQCTLYFIPRLMLPLFNPCTRPTLLAVLCQLHSTSNATLFLLHSTCNATLWMLHFYVSCYCMSECFIPCVMLLYVRCIPRAMLLYVCCIPRCANLHTVCIVFLHVCCFPFFFSCCTFKVGLADMTCVVFIILFTFMCTLYSVQCVDIFRIRFVCKLEDFF